MKRILLFILLFVSISFLPSCSDHKIGDKVYLELWYGGMKLHVDKNCEAIDKNHMMRYLTLKELSEIYRYNNFMSYCTECVSDKNSDIINNILQKGDTTNTYNSEYSNDDKYYNE